jgi:cytochrome c oxidase subunit 2
VTRESVSFEQVQKTGYRLRRGWFAFLVVLLSGAVATSLFFLPYSEGDASPRMVAKVSGGQFYWSMTPARFQAGERVRFEVTSVDVNHGMGVYDPDGKLLGSVQAMPGYHNKVDLTLRKAGDYLVSCLEFCGVKHHLMARHFQVRPR